MYRRAELLQQLDEAYGDFREAIAGLNERQFEMKWLDRRWGVREIAAHITGWLGQLGAGLERMSRGEKPQPEGTDWSDVDRWNSTFAGHARGKRHDRILHELEHALDSFKQSAMKLPEDRYAEGKTANRLFDAAGIGHFKLHTEMIREWRSHGGVG